MTAFEHEILETRGTCLGSFPSEPLVFSAQEGQDFPAAWGVFPRAAMQFLRQGPLTASVAEVYMSLGRRGWSLVLQHLGVLCFIFVLGPFYLHFRGGPLWLVV